MSNYIYISTKLVLQEHIDISLYLNYDSSVFSFS